MLMHQKNKSLSLEEAEALITRAHEQNPGPWVSHSRVVARIAKTIAGKCGLDTHRAYLSGLLHDIGRYEGVSGLHHVYAGYEMLQKMGYDLLARICLSHSFPYQEIGAFGGGEYDCTQEEIQFISTFLSETIWNDYDRLIQLSDAMGAPEGVCLIDIRILNVVRRYGFDNYTLKKWESIFSLKHYFDKQCNINIYDLFYYEVRDVSFRL